MPKKGIRMMMRVLKEPGIQPLSVEKRCLVTQMRINGLDTVMLWDSGSTSTAMFLSFVDVSKVLVFRLANPVMLQLETVSS